jgi:hypothetical protein
MLLLMLTGWDYVSELRPPTGLLFIPQVIYEYGEPRWNDMDSGKLNNPPELCDNSTRSNLVAKQEGNGTEKRWILPTNYLFSY